MMGMIGEHEHCVKVYAIVFVAIPVEERSHDARGLGQVEWIASKNPFCRPEGQVCIYEYNQRMRRVLRDCIVQQATESYAQFFVRLWDSRASQYAGAMSALSFDRDKLPRALVFRRELHVAPRSVSLIFAFDGKARTETCRFGEHLMASTLELIFVLEPLQ